MVSVSARRLIAVFSLAVLLSGCDESVDVSAGNPLAIKGVDGEFSPFFGGAPVSDDPGIAPGM